MNRKNFLQKAGTLGLGAGVLAFIRPTSLVRDRRKRSRDSRRHKQLRIVKLMNSGLIIDIKTLDRFRHLAYTKQVVKNTMFLCCRKVH